MNNLFNRILILG